MPNFFLIVLFASCLLASPAPNSPKAAADCSDSKSPCPAGRECVVQTMPDGTKRGSCMPQATQGETCVSKVMKRTCAKGYECTGKESHDKDGLKRCYMQGIKTVADEDEPCEGETNSVCPPGYQCQDSKKGKVCKLDPVPKGYGEDKLPKINEKCNGPKGKNGVCSVGLECVSSKFPGQKEESRCMPYALQGATCTAQYMTRSCAEGYECLNKTPQVKDSSSVCYMKGMKTIAKEHEGCEGTTNAICAPGWKCTDDDLKIGKWCVKE